MQRSKNPYTPGAGKRPAKLAGRDQDLDDFQNLLERLSAGRSERSVIFSGLRGVGKTVLLLEFDIIAAEANWISTGVQEVGSSADFRNSMARIALRLLRTMSLRQRMKDRARAALSVVKSFSIAGPGGIKIQLDVDAAAGTADSGDIEQDLADLFVEIGEVARAGDSGALFLLDEMQNLDEASLSAICMAYHRMSQRELPVALVGAGLPTLPAMLRSAKPYAPRLFSYSDLARLSAASSRMLLVGPAALQQVSFEEDALELIISQSGGYPYFLQEYGRVLWDEVEQSPITSSDVVAVTELGMGLGMWTGELVLTPFDIGAIVRAQEGHRVWAKGVPDLYPADFLVQMERLARRPGDQPGLKLEVSAEARGGTARIACETATS